MKNKFLGHACFFKQFLRSPCQTGSICPSSVFLADAMVHEALGKSRVNYGLMVDLGAGSGIVSQELIRHGVSPGHILAVDISENFKNIFHKNCPGVEFLTGDARYLDGIISDHCPGLPLRAIISSLPLRAMPKTSVTEIMRETRNVLLRRGGVFIQFTYAFWMWSALTQYGFLSSDRKFVFINIPPALVELYTLHGD